MSRDEHVQQEVASVRWVLIALMLGMLLAALDTTIVSTALPRIVSELGGLEYYSWVFSAYMLTSTIFVPLFGKLSDLYGRRRLYQIGLGLFVLGSALCGFSTDITQLIAFRALQGVGGAALMTIAITIIGDLFPPERRGKVQGLFGAVFGLASIAGPAVGGLLTDHLSWPWIFWINLPFGLAAMVVIAFALKETRGTAKPQIDYAGSVLLMTGLTALLLACETGGGEYGWTSWPILSLFAASAVLLILFVVSQRRAKEPLLPLHLFRNRVVSVSSVLGFLLGACMFAAVSYLPLYVQGVIGVSASLAGYILTPLMLAMIASSIVSGRLMTKVSYRGFTWYSMIMLTIGFGWLSQAATTTPLWEIAACMVILGLGMGPMSPLLNIAIQGAVDARVRGTATSSLMLFRSIGGTVGVTVTGAFLNLELAAQLQKLSEHLPAALASQASRYANPQLLLDQETREQMPAVLLEGLKEALTFAVDHVFLVALVIAVIGFAVGSLYPGQKVRPGADRTLPEEQPAAGQGA